MIVSSQTQNPGSSRATAWWVFGRAELTQIFKTARRPFLVLTVAGRRASCAIHDQYFPRSHPSNDGVSAAMSPTILSSVRFALKALNDRMQKVSDSLGRS